MSSSRNGRKKIMSAVCLKNNHSTFIYFSIPFYRLPQQDILGYNGTKVFISQGGMMSIQESLYHGVPLLIIPIFGDQIANGKRAVRQGYGRLIGIDGENEKRRG